MTHTAAKEAALRQLADAGACEYRSAHGGDGVGLHVALTASGEVDQARSCLLHRLSKARGGSAAAWHLAATADDDLAAHARALLSGKPCQASPSTWDVLGPLPIGKNEVDGDPLAAHGGALAHWLRTHTQRRLSASDSAVASELVPGGRVWWQTTKPQPGHTSHLSSQRPL